MNKNSSEAGKEHRADSRSEMKPTPELKANPWPPNRVWLPDGVVMLAAVSPELENVEGAFWIRELPSFDARSTLKAKPMFTPGPWLLTKVADFSI